MVRTALVQNYDLREAMARVDAARANLGITRADQFPTVDGSAERDRPALFHRWRNSPFLRVPRRDGHSAAVAVNLVSFEADIWGRLRRATEAARADLLASDENRKAVITTVIGDVAGAYFNLLELDMELEIARRTLAVREDSLQLIRVREQGGIATLLEVREGEQLVYGAAQVIPDTEQQIQQTENAIRLLLGEPPGGDCAGSLVDRAGGATVGPSWIALVAARTAPGHPGRGAESRRGKRHHRRGQGGLLSADQPDRFPRLSKHRRCPSLFSGSTRAWQFVPQVTQPIFNGGRIRSNVEARRGTTADRAGPIRTGDPERLPRGVGRTRSVSTDERDSQRNRSCCEATLQDRSRLAYMRYRGGVDTLLNALDADRDLFEAELGLAQTRRDELLALVQLYRALGGGWQ